MKKAILFLAMLVFTQVVFGQFKLTPNNYVSESNPDKNYIVLEFPDKSQKELFQKAKINIHSNYKNLKGDGFNEVEYDQIKLRISEEIPTGKLLGLTVTSDLSLIIELKFKDGKILIQPTFVEMKKQQGKYVSEIYLTDGNAFLGKSIFNKKGEVWLKEHHKSAENYVNEFVKTLSASLNKKEDW